MADNIFSDLGDIFTSGLEKASDLYLNGEGRFRVIDPAQQYTVLPNGQLVNQNRQQAVTTPEPSSNQTLLLVGAVLVGVVLLLKLVL